MSRKRALPAAANEMATSAGSPAGTVRDPLVFISHDSRDAKLAEEFHNLLSDVSAGTLKAFRSSDKKGESGIDFGQQWFSVILNQIHKATDVVALLTSNSLNRPWILYESGVAHGKLNVTVLGVALGIPLTDANTGPFAQFHNCGDDEDSLSKLITQLLHRVPGASPREAAVRSQVQIFKSKLSDLVQQTRTTKVKEESPDAGKMFEEVKEMFRGISRDLRHEAPRSRLFDPNVHPRIAETLLERSLQGPSDFEVKWPIFLSIFRDQLPWLYIPGCELSRALADNDPRTIDSALRRLRETIDVAYGSEIMEMLAHKNRLPYDYLRYLVDMVQRFLTQVPYAEIIKRPRVEAKKKSE